MARRTSASLLYITLTLLVMLRSQLFEPHDSPPWLRPLFKEAQLEFSSRLCVKSTKPVSLGETWHLRKPAVCEQEAGCHSQSYVDLMLIAESQPDFTKELFQPRV